MLNSTDKRQLKVLHIVGESRYGGAATIILQLAEIAQTQGWRVDVLTTDPLFQQAVRQHRLGLVDLDVIRRRIRPFWDLGGLLRLRKFLRRERYDIVHTHTSKGGFVGRLAARLASVPVIVHTVHGFAFHESSAIPLRLFYSTLERIASRWCDCVVSVSEFHRQWAIELGICPPRQIVAIPNGIADIRQNRAADAAEVRRQFGAQPGDFVVLSVARLAEEKGLEDLIEAVAMLPSTGRRIRIVIAGDGPARDRLEQLAMNLGVMDRVCFAGFRSDIGNLLAAGDLVVLPSLREGLSIALLEAMAASKPIVATSIGSHREVCSHAEIAFLVPPANALRLGEGILRLAGNPALMARLGHNARAVYEGHYTEDRMIESYRRLYFELLSAKFSAGPREDLCRHAGLTSGTPLPSRRVDA